MSALDTAEKIEAVETAMQQMEEVIDSLRNAIEGHKDERHWNSYLITALQNLTTGINPYDANMNKLLEGLQNQCGECGYDNDECQCDDED